MHNHHHVAQWNLAAPSADFTASLSFDAFALHPGAGSHYEARLELLTAVATRFNITSGMGDVAFVSATPLVQPSPALAGQHLQNMTHDNKQ